MPDLPAIRMQYRPSGVTISEIALTLWFIQMAAKGSADFVHGFSTNAVPACSLPARARHDAPLVMGCTTGRVFGSHVRPPSNVMNQYRFRLVAQGVGAG